MPAILWTQLQRVGWSPGAAQKHHDVRIDAVVTLQRWRVAQQPDWYSEPDSPRLHDALLGRGLAHPR